MHGVTFQKFWLLRFQDCKLESIVDAIAACGAVTTAIALRSEASKPVLRAALEESEGLSADTTNAGFC
ncbi:hypothetical protein [Undibacterium sp. TS12]|uniref:hypothetical protein n=1 Tax=Undibacterium sp. TS12 TaxID=2908202 RepID=UPI001F4CF907|nr:hypothetical protein [Undibacterium sp. TS12]MCH8620384.1 hypothetical protein [Undibacterium sp. TS12]